MGLLNIKYAVLLLLVLTHNINAAPISTDASTDTEINETTPVDPVVATPMTTDVPGKELVEPEIDTTEATDYTKSTDASETQFTPLPEEETITDLITPTEQNSTETSDAILQQTDDIPEIPVHVNEIPSANNKPKMTDELKTYSENVQNDEAAHPKEEAIKMKIMNVADEENEILKDVAFNKMLLTGETSAKLQMVPLKNIEDNEISNDKQDQKIKQISKKVEDRPDREEYQPENALDATIYNIETNEINKHDIQIKTLQSEGNNDHATPAGPTTVSSEKIDTNMSEEIYETRIDQNSSVEAITTRYFSLEELSKADSRSQENFTLTTVQPKFSDEKSELEEASLENHIVSSNENVSSEAFMTKYHSDSGEPSEEVVTTRYFSLESGQLESLESKQNASQESTEFNLTTTRPTFDGENVDIVKELVDGQKSHKIMLVELIGDNDSMEATFGNMQMGNDDDELHILQARPEEMIPITGITSEEAFRMINEPGKTVESLETLNEESNNTSIETGNTDVTDLSSETSSEEPTTWEYEDFEVETIRPMSGENHIGALVQKEDDQPSLDGQFLGVMRGLILSNLR